MKPKGTIYQHGRNPEKGELVLVLPLVLRILYALVRGFSAGLIGVIVIYVMVLYGPILLEELRYSKSTIIGENVHEEILLKELQAQDIDELQEEAESYGVGTNFSVVIPKINAASNVVANVDPWDKDDYESVLKTNVAHAKGTYFPGQGSNIYLFSHSTDSDLNVARYNAVFYLLRKLESGDQIIVFFSDKKYVYEVKQKLIVAPTEIEWITKRTDEELLILQTCDPPGTTWNRLILVAKPIQQS